MVYMYMWDVEKACQCLPPLLLGLFQNVLSRRGRVLVVTALTLAFFLLHTLCCGLWLFLAIHHRKEERQRARSLWILNH